MRTKPEIYNDIQYYAVLHIRAYSGSNGGAKIWEFGRLNQSMKMINSLCYLIHKIPLSLLEDEFNDNDIGFINYAIPSFLDDKHCRNLPDIKELLIEFYSICPEKMKSSLKWHP